MFRHVQLSNSGNYEDENEIDLVHYMAHSHGWLPQVLDKFVWERTNWGTSSPIHC